jgi:hypothetical protein
MRRLLRFFYKGNILILRRINTFSFCNYEIP